MNNSFHGELESPLEDFFTLDSLGRLPDNNRAVSLGVVQPELAALGSQGWLLA